jgi:hypothetical protein
MWSNGGSPARRHRGLLDEAGEVDPRNASSTE